MEAAMRQPTRFGRKLPLPSTAEIKHDLRMMAAAGELVAATERAHEQNALTENASAVLVGDLAAKHGLSLDRAQMLVDRFGVGRRNLDEAAVDLHAWKD